MDDLHWMGRMICVKDSLIIPLMMGISLSNVIVGFVVGFVLGRRKLDKGEKP